MPVKTLKQRQLEDIEAGKRAEVPCMRCLSRYADGDFGKDTRGCVFGKRPILFSNMAPDNHRVMRCGVCCNDGQDCFAPPDEYLSQIKQLNDKFNAMEALEVGFNSLTEGPAFAEAQDAVKELAGDILVMIRGSFMPYSKSLTLHGGYSTADSFVQSGVYVAGRDRSIRGVMRREKSKQAALDAIDEQPEELTPTKRLRGGVIGVGKTWADVEKEGRQDNANRRGGKGGRRGAKKPRGG